jgi:hypothetical protein
MVDDGIHVSKWYFNRYAVIGIKIPFTNMNPVINHCPVDAEILNSVLLFGMFIAILNQTLLNVALPKINTEFNISASTGQ